MHNTYTPVQGMCQEVDVVILWIWWKATQDIVEITKIAATLGSTGKTLLISYQTLAHLLCVFGLSPSKPCFYVVDVVTLCIWWIPTQDKVAWASPSGVFSKAKDQARGQLLSGLIFCL